MTSEQSQQVQLNGEAIAIEQSQTVADFLQQQQVGGRFVVVINEEVVPKSNWNDTLIQPGDRLEIMSPISGG